MLYPVAIRSNNHSPRFMITVPDLPECIASGETIEGALANTRHAIHLSLCQRTGRALDIPLPATVRSHQANLAYEGCLWGVVENSDDA